MSNEPASVRAVAIGALALVILANTAGNVLLKYGAHVPERSWSFAGFGFASLLGATCFGVAVVAYAWALRHVELNVAQMVISVQYICVIGAAAFLVGEQISPTRWLGFGLIALGIFICSR